MSQTENSHDSFYIYDLARLLFILNEKSVHITGLIYRIIYNKIKKINSTKPYGYQYKTKDIFVGYPIEVLHNNNNNNKKPDYRKGIMTFSPHK